MDSENIIAATFSEFGVRFAGSDTPNSSVVSNEDFFIYSARNMFFDGRTAKATISWNFIHFDSLDINKIIELVKKESETTQAVIAAILVMLGKHGNRFKDLIEVKPLLSRFAPLGEFGKFGNEAFEKYNISAPGLKPEPKKYIKAA